MTRRHRSDHTIVHSAISTNNERLAPKTVTSFVNFVLMVRVGMARVRVGMARVRVGMAWMTVMFIVSSL